MSLADELLVSSGAVLEIDSNGNYFLKIRSFPKEKPDSAVNVKTFTDRFYHHKHEDQRKATEFYRIRKSHEHGTEKIVKQTNSIDLAPCAHCYKEEACSNLPLDMIEYVQYTFNRVSHDVDSHGVHARTYVDKVISPVEYRIQTLRIKLDFDPSSPNFSQQLQAMICNWCEYTEYPVYTKFMLVLQCSSQFELYEELYCQHDPSYKLVPAKVDMLMSDPALRQPHRDYIWYVSNQIERTQLMFDMGCEEAACYRRLKTLKPTGNDSFGRFNDDDY